MSSPAGHGSKFGRKKEEAIQALCTHRTIEEAAGAVGIGPRTLKRWSVTNFDTLKTVLSGELANVFKRTGATDQEIADGAIEIVRYSRSDCFSTFPGLSCVLARRGINLEVATIEMTAADRQDPRILPERWTQCPQKKTDQQKT